MKYMTLGVGLLVGGWLAVSSAAAAGCGGCGGCGGGKAADEPAATGEKTDRKVQTTCPVMGGAINRNTYVDHDGKRIYVCCRGCIEAIKKDPAKYIKVLEDQGVVLDKAGETAKGDASKKTGGGCGGCGGGGGEACQH